MSERELALLIERELNSLRDGTINVALALDNIRAHIKRWVALNGGPG